MTFWFYGKHPQSVPLQPFTLGWGLFRPAAAGAYYTCLGASSGRRVLPDDDDSYFLCSSAPWKEVGR